MELTLQSDDTSKPLNWLRLPLGIVLLGGSVFAQWVAMRLAVSNGLSGYLMASAIAGGALFMTVAAWLTRRSSIWPALSWKFVPRDWLIGSVLILSVYLVGFAVGQLLGVPQEKRMATLFNGLSSLESVVLIAGIVIAAPISEELSFRHFLQGGLTYKDTQAWNWVAAILTAVVFTGMHSSYVHLTTYATIFTLALVLGWMRFRSKSIVLLVLLHGQAGAIALLLNLLY